MDNFQSDAHGGHRERLRQRVASEGFEGLQPHEIIEFLLCYAIPRQDVNALAHTLVRRFGDVCGVLKAPPEELMAIEGMGKKSAYFLALAGELALACSRLQIEDRLQLSNYRDVFGFALSLERDVRPPSCMQICLDGGSRLMFCREICPSLSWGEGEVMRQALSDVLALQARNVILLCFMDDRLPEPESYDVEHVQSYAYALHVAGSALLDVVLVSQCNLLSMRQAGLIPDFNSSEILSELREDYVRGMSDIK